MIDFEPTDEQALVVETVHQFAENEIRPKARESEESGDLPRAVIAHAHELGLVTEEAGDRGRLTVFVPGSPNPTAGRIVEIEQDRVRELDVKVSDALKTLLSVGSTPLEGR